MTTVIGIALFTAAVLLVASKRRRTPPYCF